MRSTARLALNPLLAAILCLGGIVIGIGNNGPTGRLGTNLNRVNERSFDLPFLDVFKTCRPWFMQQLEGGPFNLEEPVETDANGWPINIPADRAVCTVMMAEDEGTFPAGEYICTYEGFGTIDFSVAAEIVDELPGRIVVDITPTEGLTLLRIEYSDPLDPIRNIKLIMPDFESTHEQLVFHPDFLGSLEIYNVVRFMDWMRTNESIVSSWDDRATVDYYSQATDRGVAPEYMIELANRTAIEPWFCMPHLADDNYVTEFANLVRDTLDPDRRVFIEHSNEMWNPTFGQHDHGVALGIAAGYDDDPFIAANLYHAHRSREIFEIFETSFGGTDRLVRVLAGHHNNPWLGTLMLNFEDTHLVTDAYATAPYFGRKLGAEPDVLETINMTVPQILDAAAADVADVMATNAESAAVAEAFGIPLITYEGGQHLVGVGPWKDNEILTEKFIAANRDPQMFTIYQSYLAQFRDTGGDIFTHFTHVRHYDKFGSWGSMEGLYAPLTSSPKRAALEGFAFNETPPCSEDLNLDGMVDINDLLLVLNGWGNCPFGGACIADINTDAMVDIQDLLAVVGAWGPC